MLLARLTLACAAGSHALAAQRLGPGISLPRDFAVYPRAALLDDFVETLDAATGAGLARVRATFGAPDPRSRRRRAAPPPRAARRRRRRGRAASRRDRGRAGLAPRERARPLGAARGARTPGSAARAAARGAPPPAGGDLTVVVAPTSVERLQLVCANAARDGACLLLLNPRLALPSPVAAGATMAPLLLSDFERIYEASADALRVAGPGDHGVALHRRWPDKRYRLFARDGDRFDFVGNSARRPGADQLRAIYAETTRHRVYDGS